MKEQIRAALQAFATGTLAHNALHLFETLGYRTSRRFALGQPTYAGFAADFPGAADQLNHDRAYVGHWESIDLLFQLTAEEMRETNPLFQPTVERAEPLSYLFFCIGLKGRDEETGSKPYSRAELSQIARELNQPFPMPCLILFKHDGCLTLAVIDRRPDKRNESRDVLEKVTLIKDISIKNPHPGHLAILEDLSYGELLRQHHFDSFAKLHAAWRKTLDTSLLNKRFYEELFTWYLWAKSHPRLWFPNPETDAMDEGASRAVSVIRLLTRLMFVWFIKEKGLVPDELFNQNDLKKLLCDFQPDSAEQSDFYRAVLQNLFFATLNTPMAKDTGQEDEKRRFADPAKKGIRGYSETYGDQTKYRYADCFRDPAAALQVFENVPFLNGGLFECLDYPENKETGEPERRYDGFSMTEKKQARVPNQLFFGEYEPTAAIIAEMGGKTRKGLKLKGLLDILNGYKFTIAENTPLEEEVALDPELLGKVFENLLASYNPETQETARKQTGSFYTPREIVNYMVDESLMAYLLRKLVFPPIVAQTEMGRKQIQLFGNETKRGQLAMMQTTAVTPAMPEEEARTKVKELFDNVLQTNPFQNDPAACKMLIEAIGEAKILDPACGSGAFPMGVLHRMVALLARLDPDNRAWKETQLNKAQRDRQAAQQFEDPEIREKALEGADRRIEYIRHSFADNRHELDYTRKLFLIENCIYGVDIQQIAVQIAKLRFFISLIVDQRVDDARPNRNVLSMPNLETKFVAANTLVGLDKTIGIRADYVEKAEQELHDVRQRIFFVRRYSDKKKLKREETEKRNDLKTALVRSGFGEKTATDMTHWNPFDIMQSSPFFDAETMFGMDASFDVVIGNPPYVQLQKLSEATKTTLEKQRYETYTRTGDLYQVFYEAGLNALAPGGHLCYITSNKWMRTDYGRATRRHFAAKFNTKQVVDFGMALVFESASTLTNIVLLEKAKPAAAFAICRVGGDYKPPASLAAYVAANQIIIDSPGENSWIAYPKNEYDLIRRIEAQGVPLKEWAIKINRGILTGYNEAFIIDTPTRNRLVAEDPKSADIIKPILRGEDVKAYVPDWAGKWIVFIPWHFPLHKSEGITGVSEKAERLFAEQYPAVFAHLKKYKKELSARNKAETGIRYEWYCLQRWGANYHEDFSKPKIIYPNMTKFMPFVYDKGSFFTNQKCFIITGTNLGYLTAFLNSKLFRFAFKDCFPELLGDTRELSKVFFENVTVKTVDEATEMIFGHLVEKIQCLKQTGESTTGLEQEVEDRLARLYSLTETEKIIMNL